MSTEREQRYADAAAAAWDSGEFPVSAAIARAVMAVADAEQAEWHRRALTAEEEDHRLTRLLEQRTAALTRTIDAKNTAEARVARVEALNVGDALRSEAFSLREHTLLHLPNVTAAIHLENLAHLIDAALDGGQP